jgi:predicted RNA-binding Zn-ribbon protein involved in translation (DUF1610 family)
MKTKLTLSVEKELLQEAKAEAEKKHIPLSGLIENFLSFFVRPSVYCFKCGEEFDSTMTSVCPKCGWLICSKCQTCRCALGEEGAVVAFHMRRVYERLLGGRLK